MPYSSQNYIKASRGISQKDPNIISNIFKDRQDAEYIYKTIAMLSKLLLLRPMQNMRLLQRLKSSFLKLNIPNILDTKNFSLLYYTLIVKCPIKS